MTDKKKAKKPASKSGPTYKTKEDFMRWYAKQDDRKKKKAKDD